MLCCVSPPLLQTPFSPFRETCPCHFCEHEGHLVEPCWLPAERALLASAPRLLLLAPETSSCFCSPRTGREVQTGPDFPPAAGSRDVQDPPRSLCRAQPFVSPLAVSPLHSLSQHQEAWNSQCHNLHKILSENTVHLT